MRLKGLLSSLLLLIFIMLPIAGYGKDAGKHIYVSNAGNNTVSIIDVSKKEVVGTVRVGVWPGGMDIDPATGKLYVVNTNDGDNTISVIDIASKSVEATIKVGGIGPMHIVVDSAAKTAYSTDTENIVEGKNLSKTVSVIDLTKNKLKETIEVGIGPFDISMIGNKVYTTNTGDKTISVIDTKTNKVIGLIKVPETPLGIGVDSDKKRVYVAIHGSSELAVIDAEEDKIVELIKLSSSPWYIGVDSPNNKIYVAQREGNTISVIDTKDNKVIATIDGVKQPMGVVVDSSNNRVYVASHEDISVAVIDTKTNKVVDTIKLTLTPDSPYSGSPWGIVLY